jgi:hypothetical protein
MRWLTGTTRFSKVGFISWIQEIIKEKVILFRLISVPVQPEIPL